MGNVIVTGGSRGIGLAIVGCLARTGYRVMALARKESLHRHADLRAFPCKQ